MRKYRLLYLFFTLILSRVKAEEQCDASSGDTCSPGKDLNDANIPASSNPVLAYINKLGFFIPNDKFLSLESVPIYEQVIAKLHEKREDMKRQNLPTDIPEGHTEPIAFEVGIGIPFASRSIDSIISEIHVIIGDIYTKHEYFELARETLESGIKVKNHVMIQNNYGHKLLFLDEYENATKSFLSTIKDVENEELKKLGVTVPESTAIQGLTKVIMHDESLVEGGWNWLVNYINGRMETLVKIYENDGSEEHKKALIAMHISLFHYHDIVTKDTDAAFDHMKKYSEYRMIDAPIITEENLRHVYEQMRDPVMPLDYYEGLGVKRKTPIFIIGFPRSGSTLLEKMLNSHPLIAGLGEQTVMTKQFHLIREEFLKAPKDTLGKELKTIGLELLDKLYEQYYKIATSRGIADTAKKPRRLVDKYLGNFANLGLIHILYPNALILHVMREPMDTIFSCHKVSNIINCKTFLLLYTNNNLT